jgi:hypothetical protein
LILHPKARLSPEERQLIYEWTKAERKHIKQQIEGLRDRPATTKDIEHDQSNRNGGQGSERARGINYFNVVFQQLGDPVARISNARQGSWGGHYARGPNWRHGSWQTALSRNAVQAATPWIRTRRVSGYGMSMAERQAAFPPSSIRTL